MGSSDTAQTTRRTCHTVRTHGLSQTLPWRAVAAAPAQQTSFLLLYHFLCAPSSCCTDTINLGLFLSASTQRAAQRPSRSRTSRSRHPRSSPRWRAATLSPWRRGTTTQSRLMTLALPTPGVTAVRDTSAPPEQMQTIDGRLSAFVSPHKPPRRVRRCQPRLSAGAMAVGVVWWEALRFGEVLCFYCSCQFDVCHKRRRRRHGAETACGWRNS